jgi:hypothetical protein
MSARAELRQEASAGAEGAGRRYGLVYFNDGASLGNPTDQQSCRILLRFRADGQLNANSLDSTGTRECIAYEAAKTTHT